VFNIKYVVILMPSLSISINSSLWGIVILMNFTRIVKVLLVTSFVLILVPAPLHHHHQFHTIRAVAKSSSNTAVVGTTSTLPRSGGNTENGKPMSLFIPSREDSVASSWSPSLHIATAPDSAANAVNVLNSPLRLRSSLPPPLRSDVHQHLRSLMMSSSSYSKNSATVQGTSASTTNSSSSVHRHKMQMSDHEMLRLLATTTTNTASTITDDGWLKALLNRDRTHNIGSSYELIITADCKKLMPYFIKKPIQECRGPIRLQEKHIDPMFAETRIRSPDLVTEIQLLLTEMASIQKEIGIHFILLHGTLLGVLFGGRQMPWDDDLDAVLTVTDYHLLLRFQNQYNTRPFNGFAITHSNEIVNVIEARLISRRSSMYVDITVLRPSNSKVPEVLFRRDYLSVPISAPGDWIDPTTTVQTKCPHQYRISDIFPLRPATIEGVTLWGPNRPIPTIVQEYGIMAFTSPIFAPFLAHRQYSDIHYCFNGTQWVPLNC
jgi:hypothetical protein